MIEINGVKYLNATGAAQYVGVSRGVFYTNVKPVLSKHKPKACKRWLYRLDDLEEFKVLQTAA